MTGEPIHPDSPTNPPTTMKKASRWEVYLPNTSDDMMDAVYLASFPKIIYFWPSMLTFLLCGCLAAFTEISAASLAWWAIGIFAANLLVIVQDFDQKKFIILCLAVILIGLGGYILNLKGVTFLTKITGWLGGLDVVISAHAYFILGCLLMLFTVWGLVRPMFDYWRLEPNEFVHYIQPFGRDISVPRTGHTVNKDIPDVLEFLLTFGGGSLVIRSGDRVVARIPDIPLLGRRMKRIEKMLGVTRVHVQNS